MASLNSCTAGQNSGVSCSETTFAERSMIFCSEAERGGITVRCQKKLKGRSHKSCLYPAIRCWYALPRPFQALFFFIQEADDLLGQFYKLVGVLLGDYLLAECLPAFSFLPLHWRSPRGRSYRVEEV